ncbi:MULTISPECIES: type II secretion system protein [Romboutsia]|uniref:Type II secretory pathway, pseudopilin PulG n=1 Tax=Romboutsia ilealis TaxID=1115758 RepID=A0A1V1I0F8_9FIRM|nr:MULTISPECIES: type II secretion system protein [Romboutsia]MCI9259298.1 type II secretion system protein [Romboutsia sp.]CED92894.1 Type II secretory pathway, pseudopilin PulG [Romboutsia ilealis]
MKFKSLQKKKRAGFTLVEMVIVVTILGILSGIGFMQFGNVQETSRKNADYVAAANLATASSLYISEYPNDVQFSKEEDVKNIEVSTLKNKGYINYEPTSQSERKRFDIKLLKSGEIQVLSNGKTFYPKQEEAEDKANNPDDTK